ncbi:MAG TPA: cytidylate kinase-like family protein [Candidatus Binataceae bacterium]|nr:cytidylate kinase-like family protein [Candidatus Binataceae bacterium]
MAIIALTQHLGTRSAELGRLTAARLGYRFMTAEELITQTSRLFNVMPEQLVIVDERRPHFWERLKTDTHRFVAFFRAVVLKEMAQGNLVVTGRSVTHLLPDCGCGFKVRLAGPFKERSREVALEEKLAPAIAERRVRDYDREVRARIQTLFDVDIDDPANFGMVLNTFSMPLETLAEILASLAIQVDRGMGPEQLRQLHDAALAAEVRAALIFHPKIGHAQIDVQCAKGAVHVNGPGLVPPWDDLVNDVVRQVDGVVSVEVVSEEQPVTVRPT